jgi:hypothetical protein
MRKLPPWAWIVAAVGVGAAYFLYRKHQEQKKALEAATSASETTPQPEVAGVENPAEEYPYSISGLGGGGAIGNALETQGEFRETENQFKELFSEQSQKERESQEAIQKTISESNSGLTGVLKEILAQGSGGGAPKENPGGVTTAPIAPGQSAGPRPIGPNNPEATSGGNPPTSPAPPIVTNPGGSPQPITSSPETMHNITCGNGCPGHEYSPSGRKECMTKKPGPVNAGHPKGLYCSW